MTTAFEERDQPGCEVSPITVVVEVTLVWLQEVECPYEPPCPEVCYRVEA